MCIEKIFFRSQPNLQQDNVNAQEPNFWDSVGRVTLAAAKYIALVGTLFVTIVAITTEAPLALAAMIGAGLLTVGLCISHQDRFTIATWKVLCAIADATAHIFLNIRFYPRTAPIVIRPNYGENMNPYNRNDYRPPYDPNARAQVGGDRNNPPQHVNPYDPNQRAQVGENRNNPPQYGYPQQDQLIYDPNRREPIGRQNNINDPNQRAQIGNGVNRN